MHWDAIKQHSDYLGPSGADWASVGAEWGRVGPGGEGLGMHYLRPSGAEWGRVGPSRAEWGRVGLGGL